MCDSGGCTNGEGASGDFALSAFELEFYGVSGRLRLPLGETWSVRFEDASQFAGSGGRRAARAFRAGTTPRRRLTMWDTSRDWNGIGWSCWIAIRRWSGSLRTRSGCTGTAGGNRVVTPLTTSYGSPTAGPGWSMSVPSTTWTSGRKKPSRQPRRLAGRWAGRSSGRIRPSRCSWRTSAGWPDTGAERVGDRLQVLPVLFHLLWSGRLDVPLGAAAPPAAGSGRTAGARGGTASDRPGDDRLRPRQGVHLPQLPLGLPLSGDRVPADAQGLALRKGAHREDAELGGHAAVRNAAPPCPGQILRRTCSHRCRQKAYRQRKAALAWKAGLR